MVETACTAPLQAGIDTVLGGRVRLRQLQGGHRAGTDAVLLACGVPAGFCGCCADWGAGTGAVGLMAAALEPGARVRLVENDPAALALAGANIALNGEAARIEVVAADVLAARPARIAAGVASGDLDLVLTNPPFLDAAASRVTPDGARAKAHLMPPGGLQAWIAGLAEALRPGGMALVIHRADALPALLAALGPRFGAVTVVPVHPRRDAAATRVLVRAVHGSRAPFRLCPGLVLHEPDGRFTAEVQAIHHGERRIDFSATPRAQA